MDATDNSYNNKELFSIENSCNKALVGECQSVRPKPEFATERPEICSDVETSQNKSVNGKKFNVENISNNNYPLIINNCQDSKSEEDNHYDYRLKNKDSRNCTCNSLDSQVELNTDMQNEIAMEETEINNDIKCIPRMHIKKTSCSDNECVSIENMFNCDLVIKKDHDIKSEEFKDYNKEIKSKYSKSCSYNDDVSLDKKVCIDRQPCEFVVEETGLCSSSERLQPRYSQSSSCISKETSTVRSVSNSESYGLTANDCQYIKSKDSEIYNSVKNKHNTQENVLCTKVTLVDNEAESSRIFPVTSAKKKYHFKKMQKYSCVYCKYKTRYRSNLNIHLQTKHSNNCDSKEFALYGSTIITPFILPSKIKRLLISTRSLNCSQCNFKTPSKKLFALHCKRKHQHSKCKYCEFKSKHRYALFKHMHTEHLDKQYKSRTRTKLNSHVQRQHVEKGLPSCYSCPHCDLVIKSKSLLKEHILYAHKTVAFQCPECEFKTLRKSSLTCHIKTQHEVCELFKCTFCTYVAKQNKNLKDHFNAKHNSDKTYKCSVCDYVTSTKRNLTQHFTVKHDENAQIFRCSLCSYGTKKKGHLSAHIKHRHEESNSVYSCTLCHYSTSHKRYLSDHMRKTHKEVKKTVIKCEITTVENEIF